MDEQTPLNRRRFLGKLAASGAAAGLKFTKATAAAPSSVAQSNPAGRPIPVVLATDIGDDIDDTWALGFLLKCPELDLKLVVGEYGKPDYRARLVAKFLQTVGRGDIPVGKGMAGEPHGEGPQAEWIKDYALSSYPGKVHADGVQAIIDTIMKASEEVTIIAIGPMPNVAAALAREPRIATRARLVGMYGSVRRGYGDSKDISAEWNVKADPKACQKAFAAPWEITITPLDTCGVVRLDRERYRRIRDSRDPIASTVIQNYRLWSNANKQPSEVADQRSSVLFDTVAVYLAFSQELCRMERLGIRVTDDGFTRVDDQAKRVSTATDWKSLDGFRDLLTMRLAGRGG